MVHPYLWRWVGLHIKKNTSATQTVGSGQQHGADGESWRDAGTQGQWGKEKEDFRETMILCTMYNMMFYWHEHLALSCEQKVNLSASPKDEKSV